MKRVSCLVVLCITMVLVTSAQEALIVSSGPPSFFPPGEEGAVEALSTHTVHFERSHNHVHDAWVPIRRSRDFNDSEPLFLRVVLPEGLEVHSGEEEDEHAEEGGHMEEGGHVEDVHGTHTVMMNLTGDLNLHFVPVGSLEEGASFDLVLEIVMADQVQVYLNLTCDLTFERFERERILALYGQGKDHLNETDYDSLFDQVVLDRAKVGLSVNASQQGEGDHDDHAHGRLGGGGGGGRRNSNNHQKRQFPAATTTIMQCEPASSVFRQHDLDSNGILSEDEITDAAARALIMYDASCFVRDCSAKPSAAVSWGFGVLSVIICALISLCGVLLLPLGDHRFRSLVLHAVVAFGFGAIIGDAFFHLLPAALGLHAHSESTVSWVWPIFLVAGSIVVFAVVERFVHSLHVHDDAPNPKQDLAGDKASASYPPHIGDLAATRPVAGADEAAVETAPSSEHTLFGNKEAKWSARSVKSFGWINLISDVFHNFTDGLALGAAWSTSISLGIGTSIAVLVHEIPQELADFAILMEAGFRRRDALLFNLLSSLPAFLGLFIALPLSAASNAQMWILCIAAGGFLYIGFAQLLPELHKTLDSTWKHLALGLMFMTLGFFILILLAVYEEPLLNHFCVV